MPLTPLHLAVGWAVFVSGPRRWSFAGLSAGSIIPDVEVPVLYLSGVDTQTGHGVLHSIIGGLTIDVVLAVLAIYLLLPTLAVWWEGRFGHRWIHFEGADMGEIDRMPKLVYSAMAGVMMHLGIDFLTHTTMPYFWPYGAPVRTFPQARDMSWLIVVNLMLLALMAALLKRYLGKEPEEMARLGATS